MNTPELRDREPHGRHLERHRPRGVSVTHVERVAKNCLESARNMMGAGWWHVSSEVRRALVMERVFQIVLDQDESIHPETVLKTAHALAEEVRKLIEKERNER